MIWKIDPTHSHVSFAIRVLGVSTTKGRFNALHGHLSIDEQNPASSWVKAGVDAATIEIDLEAVQTSAQAGEAVAIAE